MRFLRKKISKTHLDYVGMRHEASNHRFAVAVQLLGVKEHGYRAR